MQASELICSQETDAGQGSSLEKEPGKVLASRNSERTLFERVEDFETRAKCLKRQPAVEIVTNSRQ